MTDEAKHKACEPGDMRSVTDGPFSLILNQVENGVAVRMAAPYLLAGG
jgi:aspartate carbamoyltransferase catalytic subunit